MVSLNLPAPLDKLAPTELLLLIPLIIVPAFLVGRAFFTPAPNSSQATSSASKSATDTKEEKKEVKSVMQPPNPDLAPPRDDPYTQEELKRFDGSDDDGKIYVAIKGAFTDFTLVSYAR